MSKCVTEFLIEYMLPAYLSGAQVDVGSRGSGGSSWLVGVISLVQDAPQQGDRRHDGVENGQDA